MSDEPASVDPEAEEEPQDGAPIGPRGRLRRFLVRPVATTCVVLSLALALALYVLVIWLRWPDVAVLADHNPKTTAFIERYCKQRLAAGEAPEVRWHWVAYDRISPHLKRAVLVSEDINFFSHQGFAGDEVKVALEKAWEAKRLPRGASTLSQQVAKNLWLSPSKNPLRKLLEALLTRQLERDLSKRRILEIYLNVAELGPGIYGAEAAARHYFGKSAAELDENESAQLAAALPSPHRWHPGSESRAYRRRVTSVLRRMDKAKFLWNEI